MKILITGAGGVVGKELSSLLTQNKNYEIFLLSNSNIKNKKKRKLKIIKHDLTKPLVCLSRSRTVNYTSYKALSISFLYNANNHLVINNAN